MTPDDFPNASSYISWVGLVEASLGPEYHAALEPAPCNEVYDCKHRMPCPQHVVGNDDGLRTVYYAGTFNASNCTSPMFKLKPNLDGCAANPKSCSICNTKYEDRFWESLEWLWNADVSHHFRHLNEDIGLKNEPHPDPELCRKVSHP